MVKTILTPGQHKANLEIEGRSVNNKLDGQLDTKDRL